MRNARIRISSNLNMNFPSILHNRRILSISLFLFFITLLIYGLSYRGEGAVYNYYVLLADAFLHGRIYLTVNPPWLNELVEINNRFYVVSPPMPAILLMPFVFLFGTSFPQPILSIIIGSLNVVLSFLVVKKYFNDEKLALWLSILFGFGTIHWYHAQVGSSWYIAHIVAVFFTYLMLLSIKINKSIFLIGLLIGFSFLARLPTILAVIFPLIYLREKFIRINYLVLLGLGLLLGLAINSLYNLGSFGSPFNIGYTLIPGILDEPWYKYGLVSFKYIPIHLQELFFSLPKFKSEFPFIIPSLFSMSIFFTTPAFLLAFFANFKKRLEFAALISILLISLPNLMHGGNGFVQFGYRHTLDFIPFLVLLTASGIKTVTWWKKALIITSILINLWGVLMISFFKIWTL